MDAGIERRVVELPLSPSRRLLAPDRFRSLKTIADRQVWAAAWERVTALEAEGWAVERAEVDWGRSVPHLGERNASCLAALFPPDLPLAFASSYRPRGRTLVHLTREIAG